MDKSNGYDENAATFIRCRSQGINRQFEAIVAWGLMFLLPEEIQEVVIQKLANVLYNGGKLLFTAPSQKLKWKMPSQQQNRYHLERRNTKSY